jgi:hypothetical protein
MTDRLGDPGVAMAQRTDRDPGEEIKILLAVRIARAAAAALDHGRRKPIVGTDKHLVCPDVPILHWSCHQLRSNALSGKNFQ